MARYKPQERHGLLLPVVLYEQIAPGRLAFALDYLVHHALDLSAMDAEFKNDVVGASAYDLRVMLKVVLLAYSHGLISSHAHIARFVSALGAQASAGLQQQGKTRALMHPPRGRIRGTMAAVR